MPPSSPSCESISGPVCPAGLVYLVKNLKCFSSASAGNDAQLELALAQGGQLVGPEETLGAAASLPSEKKSTNDIPSASVIRCMVATDGLCLFCSIMLIMPFVTPERSAKSR